MFCLAVLGTSCSEASTPELPSGQTTKPRTTISIPKGASSFALDADSVGYLEKHDNLDNLVVKSQDSNALKAEYEAGFIQGRLQKPELPATRDNSWDGLYLTDSPTNYGEPPTATDISKATSALTGNYRYTIDYISNTKDAVLKNQLSRLMFRILGIYQGGTLDKPKSLNFDGSWLPALDTFTEEELKLNYETPSVSFMDVYFINSYSDLADVLDYEFANVSCSAFVKRTPDEIFITHNSWTSFLDQSMAATFLINEDLYTVNAYTPGQVGSSTDFGYNGHGILFNETTAANNLVDAKVDALWMFIRGTLAEQFATSLDSFYEFVSLEASGTYLNGYQIVDTKTREIGLVEMSYDSFVYFKSKDGVAYDITTKPEGISKDYDHDLLHDNFIIGVNFPVSLYIREQLKSVNTRPARERQFLERMGTVGDIEAAKALITYTDPNDPLSIYGRWDLGIGETPTPKKIPDGSVDAKAVTASAARRAIEAVKKNSVRSKDAAVEMFWMKFGTPVFKGKPFIWSESEWSNQKLRDVPNDVTGDWQRVKAVFG